MEKRYQVFVSSTYEDLKEERQEVIQALLELDCIPAGMELFPAADEDQWTLIKKVIDDCDYYVVIVGGRYGSISPQGVSYTQLEYEYALQQNKPIIGFVHRDLGAIPAAKSEQTEEGRRKLDAFRSLVQQKMCKPWSSPEELGSVISRSLVKLMNTKPAVGWVRGDQVPEESSYQEILKLTKHIAELEAELQKTQIQAPKGAENLQQGEDTFSLRYSYTSFVPRKRDNSLLTFETDRELESDQITTTWNQIFSLISPMMMDEANDRDIKGALNTFIATHDRDKLREKNPEKRIRDIMIHDEDFQTIKVQLRALGLITRSAKARSLKDTATYWTLTPLGDSVMTNLRALARSPSSAT